MRKKSKNKNEEIGSETISEAFGSHSLFVNSYNTDELGELKLIEKYRPKKDTSLSDYDSEISLIQNS